MTVEIFGVGKFEERDGCWEAQPAQLEGAILSIDAQHISAEHQYRAKWICENWEEILKTCYRFIEFSRLKYRLLAYCFTNPNAFVDSSEIWSIYFDTEHEFDAVVGVEFRRDEPFQLIIGD